MNISKKILRAINEGVYNALSFNKDELESSEEFDMQLGSSKNDIDISKKDLEKKYYSQKLQEMLPHPEEIDYRKYNLLDLFICNAILLHKEYGATYNPHLDGEEFKTFIHNCIEAYDLYDMSLNWIDTSEVTNMNRLFKGYYPEDRNRFQGDISEWDVSNVTDMTLMFNVSLFNGDISNWDVSNVENMEDMFMASYFNRDISNWHISNHTNTYGMFAACKIKEEYKPKGIKEYVDD